jgi:hypothetical protein
MLVQTGFTDQMWFVMKNKKAWRVLETHPRDMGKRNIPFKSTFVRTGGQIGPAEAADLFILPVERV